MAGIHEMQMAQQGNAKQGLSGKADRPGSCIAPWQRMLLSPSTNALGSFCRKQMGTKTFQCQSIACFCVRFHPQGPDLEVT